MRAVLLPFLMSLLLATPAAAQEGRADHADRVRVNDGSDPKAIAIAQSVMEAMGGWEAWDATRYLSWDFFGRRRHWWDRRTGDIRIQFDHAVTLMNIHTKQGRAWENGEEITDPDSLALRMDRGRKIWVNDSYWLIMPYKLLDPGVTLHYGGEKAMEDGREADVLVLTFGQGVGYTPENKYDVYVARDTGLVEQWSYYENANDEKPGFTLPWSNWKKFGGILLATGHGGDEDWEISVPETLPRSVFTSPDPVE